MTRNPGSLWMLVAGLLFGCMGVFVKLGAVYFSHIELVFYRSFFGLLLVYLILRQQHISVVTQHWRAHLWRGISGTVALALFFYCITVLPLATAVTLNEHGITNIQTSAQAAQALRPVAGEFAFAVFALGIIGTGMLAVPVLAGSAAYAVSEVFGWEAGLSDSFRQARGFYSIIIAATVIGTIASTLEVDPIKALVWSAIVNGIISVPLMVVMMWIGQSKALMGALTVSLRHRFVGWAATGVMGLAVGFLLLTSF